MGLIKVQNGRSKYQKKEQAQKRLLIEPYRTLEKTKDGGDKGENRDYEGGKAKCGQETERHIGAHPTHSIADGAGGGTDIELIVGKDACQEQDRNRQQDYSHYLPPDYPKPGIFLGSGVTL